MPSPKVRLQKVLASAGISSRRAAERLIEVGRVSVNGRSVTKLGAKADPDLDDIRVDGRKVITGLPRIYLLVCKPRGYVTTRFDPEGRRTILDLISNVREYVYPVGRLDYDSEGLVILTNDGTLAARLTHPRYGVERVYEVRVRGVPSQSAINSLRRGVLIAGRRTASSSVKFLRRLKAKSSENALLRVAIREGRNRQVRKMCEAIGHPEIRLRRTQLGPLRDSSLKVGKHRLLTTSEVAALMRASEVSRPQDKMS